jgi:hypothetical protein
VPIITTQIKKSIIIEQEERMEESQKIKRAQDKQPLLYIEISKLILKIQFNNRPFAFLLKILLPGKRSI